MISEEEARNKILASVGPLPNRRVALGDALNCFAAENYLSRVPLPGFDNSAMDGYAVAANSCAPGVQLRVVGEQPAGVDRRLCISAGETVRIFTGAPIPAGADAVVMQEDVSRNGDEVVINAEVVQGDFIRRQACDLAQGQKILAVGQRIGPTNAALLAAQGFADVMVGGEVTSAVISTGDEIVSAGKTLQPGQIYESNLVLLRALLEQSHATVRSLEHCPDQKDRLAEAISRGAQSHVLIISGGVSVGEHDLVKSTLVSLGGEIDLWRVAIKPGKPFLFGRIGACTVFGLPGNPVSAFVTFLQFVRPAILKMMGASDRELEPRTFAARLAVDVKNAGDRAHYLRGRLERGDFEPTGRQESHALFGLSQSNALLAGRTGLRIEVWDDR